MRTLFSLLILLSCSFSYAESKSKSLIISDNNISFFFVNTVDKDEESINKAIVHNLTEFNLLYYHCLFKKKNIVKKDIPNDLKSLESLFKSNGFKFVLPPLFENDGSRLNAPFFLFNKNELSNTVSWSYSIENGISVYLPKKDLFIHGKSLFGKTDIDAYKSIHRLIKLKGTNK